jgi:hypothetical protein
MMGAGSRLTSITDGGRDWTRPPSLRQASKGKGNFGIGSATREQADAM